MLPEVDAKNNRYLIAKYDANPKRMEPRNVGVLLWHDGLILSKFLPAKDATFCNSAKNFARWVSHWEQLSGQKKLQLASGEWAVHTDMDFLKALMRQSSPNFLLFDGGQSLSPVTPENHRDVLDYLYEDLVYIPEVPAKKKEENPHRSEEASRICKTMLKELGFRPDSYKYRKKVHIPIPGNKWHSFKVDFRVNVAKSDEDNSPAALLNRVSLGRQNSVCGTAFMFDMTRKSTLAERFDQRLAAIYLADEAELQSDDVQDNLALLSPLCETINLNDPDSAYEGLSRVLQN